MIALAALILLGPVTAAAGKDIGAPFLGRYEADARDCSIPLKHRNDDEDETGQGGALVLVEPRRMHFVEWDWPVQSVETVNSNEIRVRLLNDVDADGKHIEVVTYSLKRIGRRLVMTYNQGSQHYYRCGSAT